MQTIRRNEDGSVDDVAIDCTMFRLEQLSGMEWWACAYRGEKAVHFLLRWDEKRKEIIGSSYDDSIGCLDDSLQRLTKTP